MAIERTFSIIKPNAVEKNVIGEIITRFEQARPSRRRGQVHPPVPRKGRRLLHRAQGSPFLSEPRSSS